MSTRWNRIASDLYEQAARHGAATGRRPADQLEHWARIGVRITQGPGQQRIEACFAGDLAWTDLDPTETFLANAQLDASIDARAVHAELGATSGGSAAATVTVAVDGQLVELHPDGTTTPLT